LEDVEMYRVQVEHQGNCSDLSAVAWVIEAGTGIYTKTSCDCGLAIASFLLLIFWLYWKHLETESHGERSQVLLDVTNDDAWFEAGFKLGRGMPGGKIITALVQQGIQFGGI